MIGESINEILLAEKAADDIRRESETAVRKIEDKNIMEIEKLRQAHLQSINEYVKEATAGILEESVSDKTSIRPDDKRIADAKKYMVAQIIALGADTAAKSKGGAE